MIRLLNIEWEKLRNYRAFWVMVLLYLFVFFIFVIGLPVVMERIARQLDDVMHIRLFNVLIFSFPDIWQNLAFFAGMRGFVKIFLAILVIILVSNEFTYLTARSNIMNGLSRTEFVMGKLLLVLVVSLASTILVFLAGLYLGFSHSITKSAGLIFGRSYFLPAYFLELTTYLTFALLIGTLIRKTGFAIITLLAWIIIEPLIDYFSPDVISKYLPLNAMNQVVWSVNTSLLTYRSPDFNIPLQEFISPADVAVCLLYAFLYAGIVWLYVQRKDI